MVLNGGIWGGREQILELREGSNKTGFSRNFAATGTVLPHGCIMALLYSSDSIPTARESPSDLLDNPLRVVSKVCSGGGTCSIGLLPGRAVGL